MLNNTSIPKELFDQYTKENRDLVLNADECLKYNVFDEILE